MDKHQIQSQVRHALNEQPITDLHTHLYPPSFGTPVANAALPIDPSGLMLWGINELVTYHYLVAEVFRVVPATVLHYEHFWKMSKTEQADHIWKHLFVERSPISEACRGVVTTLSRLGLDPNDRNLTGIRKWYAEQSPARYIDRVMELSHARTIVMTNNVFDPNERQRWLDNPRIGDDPRFRAVLRIDPMLQAWPDAARIINSLGYEVGSESSANTIENARRFLRDWLDRTHPIYVAVSLPPEFRYSAELDSHILTRIVLPVCQERNLPFAMMIGSRRAVNPLLRDGGDAGGSGDVLSVARLAYDFPGNKFLVTMLSRENQHELCVVARKFGNIMPFGCWWFLNNPSLINEIQRMRFELLGTSFIPQHSDARILDQLIYKWEHTRQILADVLADKYDDLARAGWRVTSEQIVRDIRLLLVDNFRDFLAR